LGVYIFFKWVNCLNPQIHRTHLLWVLFLDLIGFAGANKIKGKKCYYILYHNLGL